MRAPEEAAIVSSHAEPMQTKAKPILQKEVYCKGVLPLLTKLYVQQALNILQGLEDCAATMQDSIVSN